MSEYTPPFSWFGGKSRIAPRIWDALGDVPHYVEPFAGSLATLLLRPHAPQVETVNDADAYLCNFWRSTQRDPEAVAHHADWPCNEIDLHARHDWLVSRVEFREAMRADPEHYDAKIAGWWLWGINLWIGTGWCAHDDAFDAGRGTARKLPSLGDAGRGTARQLPSPGNAGRGTARKLYILETITALHERLRDVRVCCGDWQRVCSDAVLFGPNRNGPVGILLDPPYASEEHNVEYAAQSDVSGDVRAWAIERGADTRLRIALCGYEGEHAMPESWRVIEWKTKGGYASRGSRANANQKRERVWLSRGCIADQQGTLL